MIYNKRVPCILLYRRNHPTTIGRPVPGHVIRTIIRSANEEEWYLERKVAHNTRQTRLIRSF